MRRFLGLILLGIFYIVWRIISRKKEDPDRGWRQFSRVHRKKNRFNSDTAMVKDPICGTYLPKERAVKAGDEYFCSEECAKQWPPQAKTS